MRKVAVGFLLGVMLLLGCRPNLYIGQNAGVVASFPGGHCGGYEFAGHPGWFWDTDC